MWISTALVARQTKATGNTSPWCHLILAICCHSLYQFVLGPHRLTLLFAAAFGAGLPQRAALLGNLPGHWCHSQQSCKRPLVLVCYGLVSLGCSPLNLLGFLAGFLLWMCPKILTIPFSYLVWTTSPKNCFGWSCNLNVHSIGYYDIILLARGYFLLQQSLGGFLWWN